MNYATLDSLKARFGELLIQRLTDDNGLGIIDESRITPAIAAISSEIDGYLRDQYSLPLPIVPPELQNYAEDMILERIYSGKPERETPKDVKDRAASARSWLKDIKKGNAALSVGGVSGETSIVQAELVTTRPGTANLFNRDKLDRF